MSGVVARRPGSGLGAAVLAAALLACAAANQRTADGPDGDGLTAQEVLANPLDEQAYANAVRCLAVSRYRRVEIVGDQALIFHGRGDDAWLNVLPRRCAGLRPNMVLAFEQSALRVCALDRFTALPRGASGFATSICSLGAFEHMNAEQVQARGAALLAAQRNRVVARTRRSAASEAAASSGARVPQAADAERDPRRRQRTP